jgi:hypothetical protein
MKPVARYVLALLILLYCPLLRGQIPAAGVPRADSIRVLPGADSAARGVDTLRHRTLPAKSPGLAMLCSAVLPGAGQFYNQSYWKVPVVLGLGLYFASTWLDQNRRTQDFREKYAASLAASPFDSFTSDTYLRERDFYKQQRDTFAWYFVILYILNVADAYVDASLFDFDVGKDLSLRLLPGTREPVNSFPGFTLRLGF